MVSEERRRLGVIADVLDAIEFNFSALKGRYKDAVKGLHVQTRGDIYILEKNVERTVKTGQAIILKLLSEADELKAEQGRARRVTELKGSLAALEALGGALDQQRKSHLEEIDALEEKRRKRRTKKRPASVKRRA